MKNLGHTIDLPIQVFGPEINMTAIVGMALGEDHTAPDNEVVLDQKYLNPAAASSANGDAAPPKVLFTTKTRAIIFGRQFVAAQVSFYFFELC
jgi:hypothetical protein